MKMRKLSEISADKRAPRKGKALVVGFKPSLTERPEGYDEVIGVNDHELRHGWAPDWVVVLDTPARFSAERRLAMLSSKCENVIQPFPDNRFGWGPDKNVYRATISGYQPRLNTPDSLAISYTSVFFAAQVAFWMGFAEVDVTGMDLVGHTLAAYGKEIAKQFEELAEEMARYGCVLRVAKHVVIDQVNETVTVEEVQPIEHVEPIVETVLEVQPIENEHVEPIIETVPAPSEKLEVKPAKAKAARKRKATRKNGDKKA